MAKKVFKLNDKDFSEHFGESQKGGKQSFDREDLLKIAHDKHGKVKFEAKRQADKDKECEEMRYPLEQQLLALEAKFPEFIVSKAELKKRQVLIHIRWVILCLFYFFLSVLKLVDYFLD